MARAKAKRRVAAIAFASTMAIGATVGFAAPASADQGCENLENAIKTISLKDAPAAVTDRLNDLFAARCT